MKRDRGGVDVSIEMLFGMFAFLVACLVLFQATAYWHVRNVFDEAASEGARVAAAYNGACADGVAAAQRYVHVHAAGWSSALRVTCSNDAGGQVSLQLSASSVGVPGLPGFALRVTQTIVKEG